MKIKLLILAIITLIIFTGCEGTESDITIHPGETIWTFYDTNISVDKSYIFKDFSKEYKDGKCIVTINFDLKEKEP